MLVKIIATRPLWQRCDKRLQNDKRAVSAVPLSKKCTSDKVDACNHQNQQRRLHEDTLINLVLDHSTKAHAKYGSRHQDRRINQGVQVQYPS